MKNLLGLFLFALLLTSCGKSLADDVIGTWNAKSTVNTNCTDPSDNGSFTFDDMGCTSFFGIETCLSFEITEAGGFNTITTATNGTDSNTETEPGTYVLDGDNVTITVDGVVSTGTVSIDGDLMTIVGNDGECDFTITATRAE